jgi:enoyl-CoA hydratase/carnithine racemase
MSAPLALTYDGGVARLVLDRPERHNAFDAALKDAFAAAVAELAARSDLRVVIVSGAGRSFSSGADLKMLGALSPAAARSFMIEATLAFRRLERLAVPVIAAVHGYCLGGGFELALHCDFIVAADDAQFGLPEAGIGLIPTAGAAERLLATVGAMRARELLFSGRRLGADEAARAGLVAEVVARAELAARVEERARALVAAPPEGIAALKALVLRRLERDQAAGWVSELEAFESLLRARESAKERT